MTRALITGITGMVGSHLADYLLEHTDWQIHGMLRWRSPLDNIQALIPLANRGERVRFHYGDLRDAQAMRDVVQHSRPHYVFHLAAQSYPQTSFSSPCDTIDTNTNGTVRLLEALKDIVPDALIHVCSSSEVYGRTSKELTPIKEDCPFHPASPYAISKIGADMVAQNYAQAYGMRIMVTRMFTHTGPRRGDVFAESSFAKQIAMSEASGGPHLIRHGNLESIRTIADVRDAVRAYYMLMTVNPQPGAVYNIGGAYTCPVSHILDTLIVYSRRPYQFISDASRMRPIDADNQVPDCSKFMERTGWKPELLFEQTMHDLLNYWRERVRSGQNFLTR